MSSLVTSFKKFSKSLSLLDTSSEYCFDYLAITTKTTEPVQLKKSIPQSRHMSDTFACHYIANKVNVFFTLFSSQVIESKEEAELFNCSKNVHTTFKRYLNRYAPFGFTQPENISKALISLRQSCGLKNYDHYLLAQADLIMPLDSNRLLSFLEKKNEELRTIQNFSPFFDLIAAKRQAAVSMSSAHLIPEECKFIDDDFFPLVEKLTYRWTEIVPADADTILDIYNSQVAAINKELSSLNSVEKTQANITQIFSSILLKSNIQVFSLGAARDFFIACCHHIEEKLVIKSISRKDFEDIILNDASLHSPQDTSSGSGLKGLPKRSHVSSFAKFIKAAIFCNSHERKQLSDKDMLKHVRQIVEYNCYFSGQDEVKNRQLDEIGILIDKKKIDKRKLIESVELTERTFRNNCIMAWDNERIFQYVHKKTDERCQRKYDYAMRLCAKYIESKKFVSFETYSKKITSLLSDEEKVKKDLFFSIYNVVCVVNHPINILFQKITKTRPLSHQATLFCNDSVKKEEKLQESFVQKAQRPSDCINGLPSDTIAATIVAQGGVDGEEKIELSTHQYVPHIEPLASTTSSSSLHSTLYSKKALQPQKAAAIAESKVALVPLQSKIEHMVSTLLLSSYPITYAKRVKENFEKATAKHTTISDEEKSLYRHTFPKVVDQYVQEYGTVFNWWSRTKACTVKLLAGAITFADGQVMKCHIEYAFDRKDSALCFHRFIADQQTESLAKRAARKEYLQFDEGAKNIESEGTWQIQGEKGVELTQKTANGKTTITINDKAHATRLEFYYLNKEAHI